MKETNKDQLKRLVGLSAKAFILASVVAVILPMPQYTSSLGKSQYIVWVVRLSWVLLLSVGFVAILLLVGFLVRQFRLKMKINN